MLLYYCLLPDSSLDLSFLPLFFVYRAGTIALRKRIWHSTVVLYVVICPLVRGGAIPVLWTDWLYHIDPCLGGPLSCFNCPIYTSEETGILTSIKQLCFFAPSITPSSSIPPHIRRAPRNIFKTETVSIYKILSWHSKLREPCIMFTSCLEWTEYMDYFIWTESTLVMKVTEVTVR